jgi:hypothetical protein
MRSYSIIRFAAFLFFIFLYNISKSQEVSDTLDSEEEEIIDTIIVKKEPVIIKQVFVVKRETNVNNGHGLDIFLNPSVYGNYYSVCEVCKPYADRVKSSSHPVLSYGAGLGYSVYRKRFYLGLGINYNHYRENFTYTDSSGKSYDLINSLSYVGLNIGGAIRIFSLNKFQLFINTETGIVRHTASKGSLINASGKPEVLALKETDIYNKYNHHILGGFRLNYSLTSYLKIWINPHFQGDLGSVTKTSHPYLQQKKVFGTRLGVFYIFPSEK